MDRQQIYLWSDIRGFLVDEYGISDTEFLRLYQIYFHYPEGILDYADFSKCDRMLIQDWIKTLNS